MRTELSLSNILMVYRGTAIAVGAIAVVSIALIAIGIIDAFDRSGYGIWALAGAALAGLSLLAVMVLGYFSLRRALVLAEKRRREALAAFNCDALTGAFTRKYFLDRLRDMVRDANTTPVAYMQFDMDHLKAINDGNGHAAGDKALIRLVETMRDLVPSAIIGRLGGDEFAIAVPGLASKSVLKKFGERALEILDRPQSVGTRDMRLSATMGIAVAPEDAGDIDTLISKADLALYKGKSMGRRCVVGFERALLTEERHQRFVERELRAAILMDELELYYQPVFAADGQLRSYEALVRWRHSVQGMIAPDRFVPIAEQSDLIGKLGHWVLRRACSDVTRLGATVIAINVSAAELRNRDYAARFAETIGEAGLAGQSFIVEITETAPLEKNSVERQNIEFLRALGVRVAVDDFGAGHASLGYLRDLSFDIIKIDRSYVEKITTNKVDTMIVAAICKIAAALSVDVVAEGVETQEQHRALAALGCTAFQGYLLGRPEPLASIVGHQRPAAQETEAA